MEEVLNSLASRKVETAWAGPVL